MSLLTLKGWFKIFPRPVQSLLAKSGVISPRAVEMRYSQAPTASAFKKFIVFGSTFATILYLNEWCTETDKRAEWDQKNFFMKPFTECPQYDHEEKYQLDPRREQQQWLAMKAPPKGHFEAPTLPKPIIGIER